MGTLELPRPLLLLCAGLSFLLSLALVAMSAQRGPLELAWWLAVAVAVAAVAWRWPEWGPLVAGWAAFVLGFARTHVHGPNLDLGLGVLLLALSFYLVRAPALRSGAVRLDTGGLLLLLAAAVAMVSLGFTTGRIRGFTPAPGFGYHVYRLNALGLSSADALARVLPAAALVVSWFGAYLYARTARVRRDGLAFVVFTALLLNSGALIVQKHLAPGFLHPAGSPFNERWNGLTSFCWALGDGALVLFLLLPAWGSLQGRRAALTAASLLLALHAAVASGSRTALGGMLAATLAWAAARVLRWYATGRRVPAVTLGLATTLLVASVLLAYRWSPADHSTPIGRLKDAVERQGFVGHIVWTRLSSYPLTMRVVSEYPWTGIGAGLYPVEVEKYRALLLPESQLVDWFLGRSNAPNQVLNVAAELGVPAALFLSGVFVFALWRAVRARSDVLACDLGLSTLVLLGALQLGPGLYNSEALLFGWLIVGGTVAASARWSAARAAHEALRPAATTAMPPSGSGTTMLLLGAVVALTVFGHLAAARSLSVDQQWRQLRWRMNIGLQPPQDTGQWTAAEATLSTDAATPGVLLRWHAGDRAATRYAASVSFFVDGVHVTTLPAQPGVIRETRLPLPEAKGFKRISVRVTPPFVPARELGGSDLRQLGIFIHAPTPLPAR